MPSRLLAAVVSRAHYCSTSRTGSRAKRRMCTRPTATDNRAHAPTPSRQVPATNQYAHVGISHWQPCARAHRLVLVPRTPTRLSPCPPSRLALHVHPLRSLDSPVAHRAPRHPGGALLAQRHVAARPQHHLQRLVPTHLALLRAVREASPNTARHTAHLREAPAGAAKHAGECADDIGWSGGQI
jgi:hypothetical protein